MKFTLPLILFISCVVINNYQLVSSSTQVPDGDDFTGADYHLTERTQAIFKSYDNKTFSTLVEAAENCLILTVSFAHKKNHLEKIFANPTFGCKYNRFGSSELKNAVCHCIHENDQGLFSCNTDESAHC